MNYYVYLLINLVKAVHELAHKHLKVSAKWRQDWHDQKIHVQHFNTENEGSKLCIDSEDVLGKMSEMVLLLVLWLP